MIAASSWESESATGTGCTKAVAPITPRILKMLLPIRLPIASPVRPRKDRHKGHHQFRHGRSQRHHGQPSQRIGKMLFTRNGHGAVDQESAAEKE